MGCSVERSGCYIRGHYRIHNLQEDFLIFLKDDFNPPPPTLKKKDSREVCWCIITRQNDMGGVLVTVYKVTVLKSPKKGQCPQNC